VDTSTTNDTAGDAGPTSFRIALSPSPFDELMFAAGLSFSDGTRTATDLGSLTDLFVAHGETEVYARIATRKTKLAGTGANDSSLARGLDRAAVAKQKGLPFNPELGLFRTYGDVSCQTPPDFSEWGITLPGAWETLNDDQMATALRAYGAAVAKAILDSGARVEVWDVGNEIDFGTAGVAPQPLAGACDGDEGASGWYRAPDGVDPEIGKQSVLSLLTMTESARIDWLRAHLWPHEAKLLGAAIDGVRSVAPGAVVETHISSSISPTFAVAFYQAMRDGGVTLDVAGFSFYPTSSDTPPARLHLLRLTVEAVKSSLGMTSFLAEVGYPGAPLGGSSYFSTWNHALTSYPISESGQHDLFHDLASWGASGALTGVRPWAPDVFVPDWAPMSFFVAASGSKVGVAQPAIDGLREGATSPNANALKE
jgi:hypothetical protein